jgi:hypothetical protein
MWIVNCAAYHNIGASCISQEMRETRNQMLTFKERSVSTLIPVICETNTCGTVWFSSSIFGIGPGATINSTGNRASPCPICSGVGRIPDGVYTHSSASLFNPLEVNLILNALKLLHQKAAAGSTPEEIEQAIEKQFPFMSGLAKFLPSNAGELAAYLAILLTLFLNYANTKPHEPVPSVHVEVNISQALELVSSSLKSAQPNTQEQKTQSAIKRTGKK